MENGCRQSFAQRNEKALVWTCVTICVTSMWVLQVSGASIRWWRMMGYPALAWKNHSFQARESAMENSWILLCLNLDLSLFFFHSPSIFPFVDIDDYPLTAAFIRGYFRRDLPAKNHELCLPTVECRCQWMAFVVVLVGERRLHQWMNCRENVVSKTKLLL